MQGETPEQAAKCRRLFKAIVDHEIPLAALGVFDLNSQKDWIVTADNARAWQFDLISEANKSFSEATPTKEQKPAMKLITRGRSFISSSEEVKCKDKD